MGAKSGAILPYVNDQNPESIESLERRAELITEVGPDIPYDGKLFIEFHDRLLIMNGATLALSFTMAGAFHSHSTPAATLASVSSLLWAWRFLVSSIALCVVSNWCKTVSVVHFTAYYRAALIRIRVRQLAMHLKAEHTDGDLPESIRKSDSSKDAYASTSRWSTVFGVAAKIASIAGLICLYFFGSANVRLI